VDSTLTFFRQDIYSKLCSSFAVLCEKRREKSLNCCKYWLAVRCVSQPQAMFTRWRAYQVVKRIPPEDRDLLRRKLLAWELLGRQRMSNRYSSNVRLIFAKFQSHFRVFGLLFSLAANAHVSFGYCRLTGLSICPLASLLLCCSVLCPVSVSTRACLASAYCLSADSTMYRMVILSAALLSIYRSANLLFSIQNFDNACLVYLSAALLSICLSAKLFLLLLIHYSIFVQYIAQ
jgi:hypothetical protein